MPATVNTHDLKVNLVSNIARKSFTRFLLKESAGIFFLCLIAVMVLTVWLPIFIGGKRGKHEATMILINWTSENPFIIVMVGVALGLLLLWVLTLMRDGFYVVGIIVENDSFKVISRRNKLNTIRDYSGHLQELILYKDKIKFSPIEPAKLCYRVYRQSEYMGILAPDHFAWADYPTPKINNALKKLKPNTSR